MKDNPASESGFATAWSSGSTRTARRILAQAVEQLFADGQVGAQLDVEFRNGRPRPKLDLHVVVAAHDDHTGGATALSGFRRAYPDGRAPLAGTEEGELPAAVVTPRTRNTPATPRTVEYLLRTGTGQDETDGEARWRCHRLGHEQVETSIVVLTAEDACFGREDRLALAHQAIARREGATFNEEEGAQSDGAGDGKGDENADHGRSVLPSRSSRNPRSPCRLVADQDGVRHPSKCARLAPAHTDRSRHHLTSRHRPTLPQPSRAAHRRTAPVRRRAQKDQEAATPYTEYDPLQAFQHMNRRAARR